MWIDQRGSEVLSRIECLRLLALAGRSAVVGRLAVSTESSPVVHPVNFVFEDSRVLVRLGDGWMWATAPGRLVAFEVDGVTSECGAPAPCAWSVLVRGLAMRLPFSSSDDWMKREPVPAVTDPGERLLAIRPDVVTGRRFSFREAADPAGGHGPAGPRPPSLPALDRAARRT